MDYEKAELLLLVADMNNTELHKRSCVVGYGRIRINYPKSINVFSLSEGRKLGGTLASAPVRFRKTEQDFNSLQHPALSNSLGPLFDPSLPILFPQNVISANHVPTSISPLRTM
jgi:hypothetical protein